MAQGKAGRNGATPLHKAQTRTHAPMDAETFKTLGGRPRWLYEMATGAVAGDATHEPAAALNPRGLLGHDHSGPPYGSAIQHPLFTFGGNQTASQFTYDDGSNNYEPVMAIASGKTPTFVADVWVRPFAEWDGAPYSRAYLTAGVIDAAAGSGDLEVELWSDRDPVHRTSTQTISSTAWPPQIVEFPHAYWSLKPGANRLYGKFKSYSGTSAVIYSVSGNQVVKRSHNPGRPAVWINANDLTAGDISTWANKGHLGGSFSSNTDPLAVATGGPETTDGRDAYVRFDASNSESMDIAFSGALPSLVHFGIVMRWVSIPGGDKYFFDGDDASTRSSILTKSGVDWAISSGTTIQGGTPTTNWEIITGRLGSDALLRADGTTQVSGDSNTTGGLDGIMLGARYSDTQHGDFELAEMALWTNEADEKVIYRWFAERYPSLY